ncbi:hypothetical protein PMG11_06311 [Penicillium brasilianum]|uniref:N-acetyltransferase domain-containing protein n=1 Tax=Penicillium brasilianum TaxID=104259 RepID=A0A0F7TQA2_PENBI|nr:hypothetical protein PMG11_06311 [Penicillium brasilianum]
MTADTKVTLIPWDPQSLTHRQRLIKQRDECGWDQDKVEGVWRDGQTKGYKCIYWIVLPLDDDKEADGQARDASHESKANGKLYDTTTSINGVPREATQREFVPIGHISLDSRYPGVEKVGVSSSAPGLFWIKSFYVSKAYQSKGIGRAAMDEVESMAVREPLLATMLMLDVIPSEDQMREDFALATYGAVPKFSTEEWYLRRGYVPVKTVQNFYDVVDRNGKPWDMRTIFMKKEIR